MDYFWIPALYVLRQIACPELSWTCTLAKGNSKLILRGVVTLQVGKCAFPKLTLMLRACCLHFAFQKP